MQISRFSRMAAAAALVAGLAGLPAHAAELVTTAASVAPKAIAPGGHGTLTIVLNISTGAHVNAHKLANQDFIPTNFAADSVPGVKFGTPKYPAGHELTTAGLKQSVYEGDARIQIPFTVEKTAKHGAVNVGGKLTYQACNTAVCFPPKTVTVQAPVTIK